MCSLTRTLPLNLYLMSFELDVNPDDSHKASSMKKRPWLIKTRVFLKIAKVKSANGVNIPESVCVRFVDNR